MKGTRKLRVAIVILLASVAAYAYVTGPDASYTNAPGDIGNCVSCHDTFHEINIGPGSVRIEDLPSVYTPGQDYTIKIIAQQSGRNKFGFQLTAIDMSGNRAGMLLPIDANTQLNSDTGLNGRQYIQHTQAGTSAPIAGSRTWQARWTAPASDVGPVRFYVAGNAANNDGTNQNDYIYTNSRLSDSPTSVVTLSLESDPGGQSLGAGTSFLIDWTTTNPSSIDNTELRYSTDDGATFPISNLISFTTDPAVTSFDWTVPNTPTTKARLRVKIGKKSGDAVEVVTDAFTILGDGVSVPVILNASVSGKKLFVSGQNFGGGATLHKCLDCTTPATEGSKVKKVSNDSGMPSTLIVAKKAGKDIPPGSTVILQVKNPDGTLSEPFSFMRPL